jgi:hydroxypyruvate isomerase
MPKFAANLTMMFNEVPFPERFSAAAKAGFAAVEFLFPYDYDVADVTRWLKENNLKSALFNMPPGDWAAGERGIASLPGREEEFMTGVHKAIEYALSMGTPTIHAMAGLLPEGGDRARHRSVYVEPINTRDMPGYFLNTQAEGHAICKEIGAPNLKVQMDFYHAQIMEGDLSMTFRNNFKGIGHVQIASVPARHEPDEGEINYPHLFALLDEMGYSGYVGCEYRPRGKTEDGLGWFTTMK